MTLDEIPYTGEDMREFVGIFAETVHSGTFLGVKRSQVQILSARSKWYLKWYLNRLETASGVIPRRFLAFLRGISSPSAFLPAFVLINRLRRS
jgi:hypothetical protein